MNQKKGEAPESGRLFEHQIQMKQTPFPLFIALEFANLHEFVQETHEFLDAFHHKRPEQVVE